MSWEITVKDGRAVQLVSRNEKKLNDRFPEIARAAAGFGANECVVDGEVVAMDEEGRSSFQLLQGAELDGKDAPLAFYAFDLLQLNGRSLIGLPLTLRKEMLMRLVPPLGDIIRFSGALGTEAETLLPEIKRRGLEGLIGKQRDSVYEPGRRSGAWIKLKCVNEQEFVVIGYQPSAKGRAFASLTARLSPTIRSALCVPMFNSTATLSVRPRLFRICKAASSARYCGGRGSPSS